MAVEPTKVEILVNGTTWTDITTDVIGGERSELEITRGQPNETATFDPSSASMEINNRDGLYSPRNPSSSYYGQIGRNTQLRVSHTSTVDTGPVFDASSDSGGAFTSTFNWTHTPVGQPAGVLVLVVQNVGATDEVIQVEYGGVVMTEVSGSPLLHTTGSEDGALYGFHLGANIPSGENTVTVTVNGTGSSKAGVCYSVISDATTTVVEDTTTLDSGGTADPSVTLTTSVKTFAAAALHSGQDAVTSVEVQPGHVSTDTHDFGSQTAYFARRDDVVPSGSPVIGWIATSEEAGVLGVALKNGPDIARFWGEVPAWPQHWDTTGTDIWVPLEAAGISRRLGQGASPVSSTLFYGITHDVPSLLAYWPCEDEELATSIASPINGVPPGTFTLAIPDFASFTRFEASKPLPQFNGATVVFTIPSYTATTNTFQVHFLLSVPSTGQPADNTPIITLYTNSPDAPIWDIFYEDAGSGGEFSIHAYDEQINILYDSGGLSGFDIDGKIIRVTFEFTQNGADIDFTLAILQVGDSTGTAFSDTLAGKTLGEIHDIIFNILGGLDTVAFGHVVVQNEIGSIYDLHEELNAYKSEVAATRITRLCAQNSIPVQIIGDPADTQPMGAQLPMTLLELLKEAAETDKGLLFEPRNFLGFAYRTRADLYTQTPVLELNYTANDFDTVPIPVDDDQYTRNDITVQLSGGSSFRAVQDTGPLSILAPPDGVGIYDDSVTISIDDDSYLPNQALWRLHLGTVDEPRYPQIGVNLSRPGFTKDAAAKQLDIGDKISIDNLPSWVTPDDDVILLALGFTETLSNFIHRIDVNTAPASPYEIAAYGEADPAFGLTQTAETNADTYSVTKPTGTVEGDVLLAFQSADGGSDPSSAMTTPTGGSIWRLLDSLATNAGGTYFLATKVWWKLAGASEPASYGFAHLAASDGVCAVTNVKNTSTATPVVAQSSEASPGTTVDTPSTTPTGDNDFELRWVAASDSGGGSSAVTWADPGPAFDERADLQSTSFTTGCLATRALTSGSGTGVQTFTATVPAGTLDLAHGLTVNVAVNEEVNSPARYDTAGSSLASSFISGTNTSMSVNVDVLPLWTTDSADLPFDIHVGGVRLTVTAISGVSSPQTFTITQTPVNGVAKTIPAGTEIRLWDTPFYGL